MSASNAHEKAKQKALLHDVYRWVEMDMLRTHYAACTTQEWRNLCGDTYEQCVENYLEDPTLADRARDVCGGVGEIFEALVRQKLEQRKRESK